MTKRSKLVFIVLALLILAGVAIFLFCYNQEGFTARHTKGTIAIQREETGWEESEKE